MRPLRLLFIGDSLVEFFDWQKRFPGHEVFNCGVAGETLEGVLRRVGGITGKHRSPDFVFLMAGINNVAMDDLDFIDSYGRIVERLLSAYPDARIVVHSLLPVVTGWISSASIGAVNRSLEEMALERGGEYLDIHSLFVGGGESPIAEYFLVDGIHLSEEGYRVWSDAISGVVAGQTRTSILRKARRIL